MKYMHLIIILYYTPLFNQMQKWKDKGKEKKNKLIINFQNSSYIYLTRIKTSHSLPWSSINRTEKPTQPTPSPYWHITVYLLHFLVYEVIRKSLLFSFSFLGEIIMMKVWKWYQNCLAVHPVKTQVISSGILWGVGDIAAQSITHSTAKKHFHIRVSAFPSVQFNILLINSPALFLCIFILVWFNLYWVHVKIFTCSFLCSIYWIWKNAQVV